MVVLGSISAAHSSDAHSCCCCLALGIVLRGADRRRPRIASRVQASGLLYCFPRPRGFPRLRVSKGLRWRRGFGFIRSALRVRPRHVEWESAARQPSERAVLDTGRGLFASPSQPMDLVERFRGWSPLQGWFQGPGDGEDESFWVSNDRCAAPTPLETCQPTLRGVHASATSDTPQIERFDARGVVVCRLSMLEKRVCCKEAASRTERAGAGCCGHSVKACYDCEEAFSLLVRRHHCRICGHVFCHRFAGILSPASP
jgi:hypothetical protein